MRRKASAVRKAKRPSGKDIPQAELVRLWESIVMKAKKNSSLSEDEALALAVRETRAARGS